LVDPIWTEGWKCNLCRTIHSIEKDATWCCYKKALGISPQTIECPTCEGTGHKCAIENKCHGCQDSVACPDCKGHGFKTQEEK